MIDMPKAWAAVSRLKVSVSAGRSWSLAVAVKVNSTCSLTDLLPIECKTGAMLPSDTVMEIVSESTKLPSLTVTVAL